MLASHRGVGCIFFEMACGRPLFPGSTVEEELRLIFMGLGSPPADAWPDLPLPYTFPHYHPEPLLARAPRLDSDAIDLLNKFLCVSLSIVKPIILTVICLLKITTQPIKTLTVSTEMQCCCSVEVSVNRGDK